MPTDSWRFVPLGDQAVLIYCPQETFAWQLAAAVRRAGWPWVVDVVAAYASVAVFYEARRCRWQEARQQLEELTHTLSAAPAGLTGRRHEIPCCYDLQLDLERVAQATGLTPAEVVHWHVATEYTVYAIGFCPGFPYLGYLPPPLCGVPRLPAPRRQVAAGSVGLAGRQTGIYTEARPGGWNIIGRTPLVLVDLVQGYFPLRVGDRVRFFPIDRATYQRLLGSRLPAIPVGDDTKKPGPSLA
jgi:inhibitor of KinA